MFLRKMARPTIYTKELASKICDRISRGESLRKICREEGMPERRTIHLWLLDEEKKEFFHQYEKACNIRAEDLFDEIEEIADNKGEVQRDRLRVDTRKWYLSKVLPKKFGDKIDITSGNKPIPILNALSKNNSDRQDTETNEEN